MKTLFKTFRILNTGILLGMAFTIWMLGEEKEEKSNPELTDAEARLLNNFNKTFSTKENINA